jgi:hypothetical protein
LIVFFTRKAGIATHYIPAAKLSQVEEEISKVKDTPPDIYIDKLLTKFMEIPSNSTLHFITKKICFVRYD